MAWTLILYFVAKRHYQETQAMDNRIQIELAVATSDKGFSLDELVLTFRELMATRGLAGVLELVLNIVDEHLCLSICRKTGNYKLPECCQDAAYEVANHRSRKLRTSVGSLRIKWRYLRCKKCRTTFVPLREFLGLELHQSKATELERKVVEVVSEQSYRRGSAHLKTIGEIPVPKSTAHRWVAQSDCDKIDTGTDTLEILYADGTGYKRRCEKSSGQDNKGQVRIAFGIDNKGKTRPLGAWSGDSWKTIAANINGQRKDDQPVANLLLSDGERGLITALEPLCDSRQRCHWHAGHDLSYTMWSDGAPLRERKDARGELAGIIGVELPKEDIEKVSEEDRQFLMDEVDAAEVHVDKLYRRLVRKGYVQASEYIARLRRQLFSYVRLWLETGLISPRAASWIERVMREVGRRLKRMAFGWSEAGAAKMSNIILKRFTNKKAWDEYWKKKLRIEGNVIWLLRSIKTISPANLGH